MQTSSQTEHLFAGLVMKRLLASSDTEGRFCLLENTSGGQTATPVHVHKQEDETIYVFEGRMEAHHRRSPPEDQRRSRGAYREVCRTSCSTAAACPPVT